MESQVKQFPNLGNRMRYAYLFTPKVLQWFRLMDPSVRVRCISHEQVEGPQPWPMIRRVDMPSASCQIQFCALGCQLGLAERSVKQSCACACPLLLAAISFHAKRPTYHVALCCPSSGLRIQSVHIILFVVLDCYHFLLLVQVFPA